MPGPGDELVEVLDEGGHVRGVTTRRRMRTDKLWHRCVFVAVLRGEAGLGATGGVRPEPADGYCVVVHQRASWKEVYPSYWDLCFGGVCGADETWEDAARRELYEEAGIVDAALVEVGAGTYADDVTKEHYRVYLTVTDQPVAPVDDEVVAVDTVRVAGLRAWTDERDVCPDSLLLVGPHLGI